MSGVEYWWACEGPDFILTSDGKRQDWGRQWSPFRGLGRKLHRRIAVEPIDCMCRNERLVSRSDDSAVE